MKKLVIFAVVILLTAGIAYAKEFEVKEKAGVYQVEFKIDNLRIGANNVKIAVKDDAGKYVSGAKVEVEYSMPEGVELPPMNFKKVMKPKGKEYKGKIRIPMAGTWTIVVNIMSRGKISSANFSTEVH